MSAFIAEKGKKKEGIMRSVMHPFVLSLTLMRKRKLRGKKEEVIFLHKQFI